MKFDPSMNAIVRVLAARGTDSSSSTGSTNCVGVMVGSGACKVAVGVTSLVFSAAGLADAVDVGGSIVRVAVGKSSSVEGAVGGGVSVGRKVGVSNGGVSVGASCATTKGMLMKATNNIRSTERRIIVRFSISLSYINIILPPHIFCQQLIG